VRARERASRPGCIRRRARVLHPGRTSGGLGVVGSVVGAPFAVLVAEELFASGCELLIHVTPAGQIGSEPDPPFFILIETALRDEGTSYHYLPPGEYAAIDERLLRMLEGAFDGSTVHVRRGRTWTTDGPFRETLTAIEHARREGLLPQLTCPRKQEKGGTRPRSAASPGHRAHRVGIPTRRSSCPPLCGCRLGDDRTVTVAPTQGHRLQPALHRPKLTDLLVDLTNLGARLGADARGDATRSMATSMRHPAACTMVRSQARSEGSGGAAEIAPARR
jgi:hypothetical protein